MYDDDQFNGYITLLINEDGIYLELLDKESFQAFAKVQLHQDQTCRVLSRQGMVKCNIRYAGLDRVGKKLETDHIEFPMPDNVAWKDRDAVAYNEACKICPEGWVVGEYFGSKGSFFYDKSGKEHGRATIRRWVSPEATEA